MELRTVALPGTPAEDLIVELLVLVGDDGRIEGVQNLSKTNQAAFGRVQPRITAAKVSLPRPDGRPVKIVRRGLLACHHLSTCSVVFDLPGTRPIVPPTP